MKKTGKFAASIAASAALLLNITPAFAVEVSVTDNGNDSTNTANVSVSKTTSIYQTNNADVNNNANVGSNTGSNTANDNTGGDVSINTGDASTNLTVNNQVNSNKTHLVCCDPVNALVSVSGNGADSNNTVNLNLHNQLNIVDQKWLSINNNFEVDANTGDNEANGNTDGDVTINTGNASINVSIDNKGNFNEIILGAMLPENPDEGEQPNGEEKPLPGLPKPGSVLGANNLPMTGFDYPFRLILVTALSLVGAGLILRQKSEALEETLSVLASKFFRA